MGDAPEADFPSLDDWGGELADEAVNELSDDAKLDYMEAWFRHYYEDPAHSLPYVSAEGGYQWVTGGPYQARLELSSQFEGVVANELIEKVAQRLDGYGFEWAPSANHPDRADEEAEPREPEVWEPDLDDIIKHLEAGGAVVPDEPDSPLRLGVLNRLEALETAVAELRHVGMGHNRPPEGLEEVQAVPPEQLDIIAGEIAVVRAEIAEPEPNALAIAKAGRNFREVGNWLGAKLGMMVDEAVKTYGKGVGAAALAGTALAVGIGQHALLAALAQAVHAIAVWAASVTAGF
ncbi:MAG TPA: hypothetical protein VGF50_01325 [Caulobacteraceae bacterium]|jgi:hypothetical protein